MSAKKRAKKGDEDTPARERRSASEPVASAESPMRLPVGTHVVYGRKVTETDDGAEVMACFEGVVVSDGSERVDVPNVDELQLRCAMAEEGGQDKVWWEPTCNVYEIISGPSSTATALACEGVRRWHIKSPCAQAAFLHKVEQAKDERAWLDADAGKVLSPRGIFLGPHIQGILSYSTGQPGRSGDFTGVPLRHYLLLSSADRRPCNSGFHDMRCTSDSTTAPRRKPQKEGNSPIRCDYCQRLYDVIRPHMNDMTRSASAATTTAFGHQRNDVLTRRQQLEKLLAIAAEKKKLQAHVRYLKACNVAQMADKECASVEVSSAVAGNEINAKEYTAVLSAACDSKDLMRAYYTEALDTPEQADAAIAIMESGLRNMRSYMDTGTKCGFRYSPLCFASAIDMFSRILLICCRWCLTVIMI